MIRRIFIFIFSGVFLWILSCSGSHSTAPGTSENIEPIASETIGSEGGTIEAEGFSLNIPENAFDTSHEVSVYADPEDNSFGDDRVTELFTIEGLPETYNKPLRLTLKYDGSLNGDTYTAYGRFSGDFMSADSLPTYIFLNTQDSSGYLVSILNSVNTQIETAEVRKGNAHKFSDDLYNQILLTGISGYGKDSTDYFQLKYPNYLQGNIAEVKMILNDCYETIVNEIGFPYYALNWKLPIQVHIRTYRDEYEEAISHIVYNNEATLNIDVFFVESSSEFIYLKKRAGNQLLQIFFRDYKGNNQFTTRWFQISVLTWADEFFDETGNYTSPSLFKRNEMAPFNGMQAGAGQSYQSTEDHGYGMAAVFKYLMDDSRYGSEALVNTFDDQRRGESAVSAIVTNMNALVAEWWPQFFIKYVGGEIYNVSSSVFTKADNLSGTWNIDSDTDTVKTFTSSEAGLYPDLSARLFMVNLNDQNLDAGTDLTAEVTGEVTNDAISIIAFVLKDSILEYLGDADATTGGLEIQGLSAYVDNGWNQLLFVVVNSNLDPPYTGSSDIDLTLRTTEKQPELSYDSCLIAVEVMATYQYVTNDTTYNVETWTDLGAVYSGSFSGNTFTGSYVENWGEDLEKTGNMTITLNDSRTEVVSFFWDEQWLGLPGPRFTRNIGFSGHSIERYEVSEWDMLFGITGQDICNHIDQLSDVQVAPDGLNYSILSYRCTNDSKIRIEFNKTD